MKDCLTYAPMISARQGELEGAEEAALARHLAGCADCRARKAGVAVRLRISKGSKAAATVDPQLEDLKLQLSKISYTRWEQVREEELKMEIGQQKSIALPDGSALALTLEATGKDTVTFKAGLPAH